MTNPFRLAMNSLVVLGIAISGCTTKFNTATDAHNIGDFEKAASNADSLAPMVKSGGTDRLNVQYERDEMWIGLEKAKILADAKRTKESIDVFSFVDNRAMLLSDAESWYAKHPFDMKNWDAKQFIGDASQSVMGADQIPYVVQPYELILVNAYRSLYLLLDGQDGAKQVATRGVELQQFEKEDLKHAGYDDMTAPIAQMDGALKTSMNGNATDFSFAGIFSLGDFTGAKERMNATITAAREVGAANPSVPFATVVEWAAFMTGVNSREEANAAAKSVGESSGARSLSEKMLSFGDWHQDFVLVLIDSGRGPVRGSFDVKFPIVIPKVGSTFFRAVYPVLKFRVADRPSDIKVGGAGVMDTASILDSIDAIAARNFQRRENELWWIPTYRAVFRAVATIVAQATQKEEDKTSKALIGLFGAIVAAAEQPDLRARSTLPASQYAAIVPRPADGVVKVELKSPSSSGTFEVKVGPGSSIVYVRALTPKITQFQVAPLQRR